MSNRRLPPPRRTIANPPAEQADPEHGFDTPEAIEALERAAAELVQGSNLDPKQLVLGLLSNEADRQVLERDIAVVQHILSGGKSSFVLQLSEDRNTAEARLLGRALQRLARAKLVFLEDPHDLSRFADRRQSQQGKKEFGREKRSLPHRPDRRGR